MKPIRKSMRALSWGLMLVGVSATIAMGQLRDLRTQVGTQHAPHFIPAQQNEFLAGEPHGWGLVGKNFIENDSVEDVETSAVEEKQNGLTVFFSRQHRFRTDQSWQYSVPVEKSGNSVEAVDRKGPMTLKGSKDSDVGWFGRHIPYLKQVKTVIRHPHLRVGDFIGGSTTDLLYNLRRDGYARLEWQMKF